MFIEINLVYENNQLQNLLTLHAEKCMCILWDMR